MIFLSFPVVWFKRGLHLGCTFKQNILNDRPGYVKAEFTRRPPALAAFFLDKSGERSQSIHYK
jgi:hypothetical protein